MGKLDSHMEINEVRTLPYTIHKDKSIWLKDLKIIQDTIKLLEENIGKAFSNISCINVFIGQSIDIKAKLNKRDLIKLTSFCTAKETIKNEKGNLQNGIKYLQGCD